jgi:hypothetical protein
MRQLRKRAPRLSTSRFDSRSPGSNVDSRASTLALYLGRDARSLNRIAQAALIDVAYLWRLREGEKRGPSWEILIRLPLTLRVETGELDELLVAAGYTPMTLRPLQGAFLGAVRRAALWPIVPSDSAREHAACCSSSHRRATPSPVRASGPE